MDFGTILSTIIGVVATIIVGYQYSSKKSRTSILYFNNQCIPLFDTLTKNLSGLKIEYQGKNISENLVFIKSTFLNDGDNDVDKNIIYEPLRLDFPNNHKLIEAKIVDNSKGLQVLLSINNNSVFFDWDILKESEFFTFECLVEYKPFEGGNSINAYHTLWQNIKLFSRIKGLKEIQKTNEIPLKTSITDVFFSILGFLFAGLIFFGGGLKVSVGQFIYPHFQEAIYIENNGNLNDMNVKALDDSTVQIKLDKGKQQVHINDFEEYFKSLPIKVKITKMKFSYVDFIIGLIMIVGYIVISYNIIKSNVKDYKLRKKLVTINK